MKLNNKGFAITTIIYGTLVVFLLLLASLLGILSTHKVRLQKLKEKTIEIIDPKELECTISYEKSSNKILRVKSGKTNVSIRTGASTTTTRLASVNGGAEFPYIPSTESTNECAGGWKKILYNKTTEAYICGTYTEVLDYSKETFTDKYYRIIDLKINASKTNGVTYSFDGKTYSTVNTLPTVTSGTHTAYIKDSNDNVVSCSVSVSQRKEYGLQKCTDITWYWNMAFICPPQGTSGTEKTYSGEAYCNSRCTEESYSCKSSEFDCKCTHNCTCNKYEETTNWYKTKPSSSGCDKTPTRNTYAIK